MRIWTANAGGSVSKVNFDTGGVTTVTTGFVRPKGITYDGTNVWVTDSGDDTLKRLDASGAILQTVNVGDNPSNPAFDGANIWVPNILSATVVRATGGLAGTVLATLSGNGLNGPHAAAFDGERILVTNPNGHTVSLWRATDLTPIVTFSTGAGNRPRRVCSDGINFWITLYNPDTVMLAGKLARF